ncbi:MAG: efflux RND transporter periplasmic adaptor subunit, partial [Arenibacter sp.]
LLDEGELLTTLSDNSKMWIYFNVPEAEYLDYITSVDRKSNKEVSLLMANNKRFSQTGIVETIEGEFSHETGNIAFRATFNNPDGVLRHGETGSIIMEVPHKNALIIPQKATFEVLDKKYVFVVDEKEVIRQKEITLSGELPNLFIVKHGITEKDRIILDGIRMVKDGDHIETEYIEPKSVVNNLALYAE